MPLCFSDLPGLDYFLTYFKASFYLVFPSCSCSADTVAFKYENKIIHVIVFSLPEGRIRSSLEESHLHCSISCNVQEFS